MFRYHITLNEEESAKFIERMENAKPNPKMQEFLQEAKKYSKEHPIRTYEENINRKQITDNNNWNIKYYITGE